MFIKLYFFDDKGISTLVKSFVTKFISSSYYTSMADKITDLNAKVDGIISNNNSADIVGITYTPGVNADSYSSIGNPDGSRTFHINLNKNPYPEGFDMNNSIIAASNVMHKYNNDNTYYRSSVPLCVEFRPNRISCIFTVDQNAYATGYLPGRITLYFTKMV